MRCRLVALAVIMLALVGAPPVAAQTSGALTGEVLNGTANPSLGIGAVAIDCEPAGTSSATYSVVGSALGPFPGTVEETGSFTIVNGQVTAFQAAFTIQSGLTQIEGTKTLRTSTSAVCSNAPEPGIASFTDIALIASYEATITTPLGTFTDEGRAASGAQMLTTPDGRASAATQESFISEGLGLMLAATAGHVTGGGYIGDVVNEWVSFGFTAKGDGTAVKAQCSVSDRSTGVQVKCLDATMLARTATHATFMGQARVDGALTGYRIDVDDLGERGAGLDTFKIQTDNGFVAAGILAGGNLQIHD
jgi:hypothetical protein